jgi:subtilisin family serine protease
MKRLLLVFVLTFYLVVCPINGARVFSSDPLAAASVMNISASQTKPDCQVLVHFKDSRISQAGSARLAQSGLPPLREIPRLDIWRADCSAKGLQTSLDLLEQDPQVAWAEPNGLAQAHAGIPDDPFYPANQANLLLINAPQAWTLTHGDVNPVAIVDTGVDLDHPDLIHKIWTNSAETAGNGIDDDGNGYVDDLHGWNFVNNTPDVQDDSGHGSHVAGIAAAETNNAIGIAGISWLARIMALKALNGANTGSYADVAEAIVYAADNGAEIINLSLGTDQPSLTIQAAIQYARQRGCLLVASAGNSGGPVEYPAAYPEVLAVAATTNSDLPADFTSRGPQIDLAAPGVDIFSANNRGFYYFSNGTSASAPQVSAVAALVWAIRPDLTADQVDAALKASAHDIWTPGWDELTGFGRLDARAAVQLVSPYPVKSYFPLLIGNPQYIFKKIFIPYLAIP